MCWTHKHACNCSTWAQAESQSHPRSFVPHPHHFPTRAQKSSSASIRQMRCLVHNQPNPIWKTSFPPLGQILHIQIYKHPPTCSSLYRTTCYTISYQAARITDESSRWSSPRAQGATWSFHFLLSYPINLGLQHALLSFGCRRCVEGHWMKEARRTAQGVSLPTLTPLSFQFKFIIKNCLQHCPQPCTTRAHMPMQAAHPTSQGS